MAKTGEKRLSTSRTTGVKVPPHGWKAKNIVYPVVGKPPKLGCDGVFLVSDSERSKTGSIAVDYEVVQKANTTVDFDGYFEKAVQMGTIDPEAQASGHIYYLTKKYWAMLAPWTFTKDLKFEAVIDSGCRWKCNGNILDTTPWTWGEIPDAHEGETVLIQAPVMEQNSQRIYPLNAGLNDVGHWHNVCPSFQKDEDGKLTNRRARHGEFFVHQDVKCLNQLDQRYILDNWKVDDDPAIKKAYQRFTLDNHQLIEDDDQRAEVYPAIRNHTVLVPTVNRMTVLIPESIVQQFDLMYVQHNRSRKKRKRGNQRFPLLDEAVILLAKAHLPVTVEITTALLDKVIGRHPCGRAIRNAFKSNGLVRLGTIAGFAKAYFGYPAQAKPFSHFPPFTIQI